jgi:hypothetical protein
MSRSTKSTQPHHLFLNNQLYKIPRNQVLKKLITKIHACSYIESLHAYSYHVHWLVLNNSYFIYTHIFSYDLILVLVVNKS